MIQMTNSALFCSCQHDINQMVRLFFCLNENNRKSVTSLYHLDSLHLIWWIPLLLLGSHSFTGICRVATPSNFFSNCLDLFKSLWNSKNQSLIHFFKRKRKGKGGFLEILAPKFLMIHCCKILEDWVLEEIKIAWLPRIYWLVIDQLDIHVIIEELHKGTKIWILPVFLRCRNTILWMSTASE